MYIDSGEEDCDTIVIYKKMDNGIMLSELSHLNLALWGEGNCSYLDAQISNMWLSLMHVTDGYITDATSHP